MIVVLFLFPLALYLFALGVINRRDRPLLLPATWDFAGLIAAASGFLVFGVPAALTGFSERWRTAWLVGRVPEQALSDGGHYVWVLLTAGYFLVVVVGAAAILWRRRLQTAVYNVEASAFEEALATSLDAAGVGWTRRGDALTLQVVNKDRGGVTFVPLELDLAPTLRHATLLWGAESAAIKPVVEAELRRALADVRTADNPAAGWLLGASTVLLLATLVAMGAVAVARIFLRQ